MTPKRVCCFFLSIVIIQTLHAQDKLSIKFGDVTAKDFATKIYSIDSSANAVVIADVGSGDIEGNNNGWFSVVSKHFKRVHILNKNGFDIANVSISLFSDGTNEEKLDKLRAITYNLDNGKVVETKLDTKSGVFEDKISKQRKVKKFTFPNIKEGSIIEYEYTTRSDYIEDIDPWEFQGSYPRLWSEYTFTVPSFFNYVFLTQGYLKYDVNDRKEGRTSYSVNVPNNAGRSEYVKLDAGYTDYRWVMKNTPALKEENYTSTLNNHIQKISFVLVEQSDPLNYHRYVESWPQIAGSLLDAEYFGQQLDKDNGWLNDVMSPLLKGISKPEDKARKIYEYLRDNFTCTSHNRWAMDQTLKNLLKSKNGSVAEINLLLTAMLRHEKINADPVILSTRSNGVTYAMYPALYQYNYVISQAIIDGKTIFFDATEPHMGFGRLPLRCYNGYARVINRIAESTVLNPDSLKEVKFTNIFIVNDEKGNLVGSMQQTPGYYESDDLRNRIKDKGMEQLQKDIKKVVGSEIVISNFHVDSLDKYDYELGINYDFDINDEKEDIIYFNPMFGEGYKENPFKSAERFYPVEMPYTIDETINLTMEVPRGYVVDELPKSTIVKLDERDSGVFEYRISQSGDKISFRSLIRLNRAYFLPDEYEILREFFNLVVKKQAEQIVFKKKK